MKKLLSRITIALFVTLYACYPVHAGVGDVYYCVTDKFILYDDDKGDVKYDSKGHKFKFKWEEDMITFGSGFIYEGFLYLDKEFGSSNLNFQARHRQSFAFFEGSKLSYVDFFYKNPRRMVFATCDKF